MAESTKASRRSKTKRSRRRQATVHDFLIGDASEHRAVLRADHGDPHRYLGPHPAQRDGDDGVVIRVLRPKAVNVRLKAGESSVEMTALDGGLFAAWLPGVAPDAPYRLHVEDDDGNVRECEDPYRFPPTLDDLDLYLFSEGTHRRLWECLGARPMKLSGVDGFAFAVWAPNARRVSVVGNLCRWDGRELQMRRLGSSGIFELFVPGIAAGEVYKFEILTQDGTRILKADPLAHYAERRPETASRTFRSSYAWDDETWMQDAAKRDVARQPMAIYEVHAGSWMRSTTDNDFDGHLGYRQLAKALVEHVKLLGFNYIQLLPVAEHPFDGSWGYQITGFYAPTSRYGDPDDFRFFVDHCHQNGIGVIIDWVPAHFVKDAHGLGRFDGTALYEHQDPRQGEHPDWGTYIFNYDRHEVRSFLIANALYWLDEFHVDGLRVDAVASMLYLDYSREDGEWIANAHGGNENLAAVTFLQEANEAVRELYPGRFVVAEESTAWAGVTHPVADGGLGFTLKWNMGWMHDTLNYFSTDPYFRSHNQDRLTFAMVYEYSEKFINPLSHDEVVHGKRSLLGKMPGDRWQQLANLRALFTYQLTRPGKTLLFMGSELAPDLEWNHQSSLDWSLLGEPENHGVFLLVCDLGSLYRKHPCLWQSDPDPEGFRWIACWDKAHSVVSYARQTVHEGDADQEHLVIVLNLTPMPRDGYRIGAPAAGTYRRLLSSDDTRYGGSGYGGHGDEQDDLLETEPISADGCPQSLDLVLPPLAALILEPVAAKGSGSRSGK